MIKRLGCILLIFALCICIPTPVDAKESQMDYRIYLQGFGHYVENETLGIYRVGWGDLLIFAMAKSEKGSAATSSYKGNLKDGESPARGASWDALLPDGTIVTPSSISVGIDPIHDGEAVDKEEQKKWEQDYASFRVPFEMTGTMTIRASIDGEVVAEYDVIVVGEDLVNNVPLRGWTWSLKERYYIKDNGKLARGWFKDGNNWYYMNQNGAVQIGWQKLSYNGKTDWYYLGPDSSQIEDIDKFGKMCRGWTKVDDTWYYLRKDGTLASNEWYRGYWVSADGSWKYKPKGSWKHDKNGWWFGDTSGWYAKDEQMKINGVLYTFDAEGYLVE